MGIMSNVMANTKSTRGFLDCDVDVCSFPSLKIITDIKVVSP